jgi:serine/threonine protein kinase
MQLSAGSRLGPYEITAEIGAGGMGVVYRARDSRLERDVALKVLPENMAADENRRQRFEREARAASAISHPNIVSVYDVGREGET